MNPKLTREQKQAVQVYLNHEAVLDQLIPFASMLDRDATLLPTNFMAFTYLPISKSCIPKEKGWSWNQSNIKTVVPVSIDKVITLKKISPRKLATTSMEHIPSYKIWMFEIIQHNNASYFIWCEKGYQPLIFAHSLCIQPEHCQQSDRRQVDNGLVTPIGTIFPQQLSLQSLSFLRDFLEDRNLATELGW